MLEVNKSSALPVTVKTLETPPPMDAAVVMLKVTEEPGAISPRSQVMTPAKSEHAPCGVEMKFKEGGRE